MPDTANRTGLIPVAVVAVALVVLVVLVLIVGRDPIVRDLEPRVAETGEEVTLRGEHFGESIGDLVFGGRELPTSSIVSWTSGEIRFRLPADSDSGLLYVQTDRGRSDGTLLQVASTIPRTTFAGERPGAPLVNAIDSAEAQIGGLVTLEGENFGTTRRDSRVVFAMSGDAPCSSCSREIAYVSWSDSSITVRVPSGAVSGFVAIETRWGTSNPIRVSINRPAGSLVAERPVEIAVRYGARLHSVEVAEPADTAPFQPGQRDIALRLPSPPVTLAQRAVRALNDEPSELRFEQIDGSFEREVVRTMILDRYALRADLDPARMATGYERESGFFAYYTRPLPDLPVDSPRVNDIAVRLRSGRAAPYRIAEAAYEATLDTLTYALGRGDHSVLAGLESGYGDDYTYAMLFVSLLRAAEVPSRPVGGVLVTDDNLAYSHFWAEFFVTGVGWIPVDPSLGDGAFPARFPVPDDPRSFYFGNLDNRRISFQRGCDVCEPTFLDGPVAFPDDPYTQQRTYAVGGSLVSAFTLDWYRPRVFGRFGSD